jgi:hypothetical protein
LWLANVCCSKVSAGIAIVFIFGILIVFSNSCPVLQAQTGTSFTPKDNFAIPLYHGSISFGVNGSYSTATFDNDSWTFTNLFLDGSSPIATLKFSAQDFNVTIFSYVTSNNTGSQSFRLRYVVEGKGKQILNFGLGPEESASFEWTVSVNSHVFGEGSVWTISHDGTIIVNGAIGNVSIAHYDFGAVISNSNLPFYQQHSVAIAMAVAVAVTVAIAVVTKLKTREPSAKMR